MGDTPVEFLGHSQQRCKVASLISFLILYEVEVTATFLNTPFSPQKGSLIRKLVKNFVMILELNFNKHFFPLFFLGVTTLPTACCMVAGKTGNGVSNLGREFLPPFKLSYLILKVLLLPLSFFFLE